MGRAGLTKEQTQLIQTTVGTTTTSSAVEKALYLTLGQDHKLHLSRHCSKIQCHDGGTTKGKASQKGSPPTAGYKGKGSLKDRAKTVLSVQCLRCGQFGHSAASRHNKQGSVGSGSPSKKRIIDLTDDANFVGMAAHQVITDRADGSPVNPMPVSKMVAQIRFWLALSMFSDT